MRVRNSRLSPEEKSRISQNCQIQKDDAGRERRIEESFVILVNQCLKKKINNVKGKSYNKGKKELG